MFFWVMLEATCSLLAHIAGDGKEYQVLPAFVG